MMNCFCGMVDRREAFSLISSRDLCQKSSPLRISEMPRTVFEPALNLSLGFVKLSCALMITATPRWPMQESLKAKRQVRRPIISARVTYIPIFQNTATLLIFYSRIIQDFDIFIFFKNSRQRPYIFHFLKDRFRLGCFRKMNLGTFWEIYVGFLKNIVSQFFSKYCLSYINLKVKSS